jgi:hypothetical protein
MYKSSASELLYMSLLLALSSFVHMMYTGVLHAAQGAAPCVNYAACIAAYVHNELKVNTMLISKHIANQYQHA